MPNFLKHARRQILLIARYWKLLVYRKPRARGFVNMLSLNKFGWIRRYIFNYFTNTLTENKCFVNTWFTQPITGLQELGQNGIRTKVRYFSLWAVRKCKIYQLKIKLRVPSSFKPSSRRADFPLSMGGIIHSVMLSSL